MLLAIVPALTATMLTTSASAASRGGDFPDPPANKRVELTTTKTKRSVTALKAYTRFDPARHAALPKAQTATVAVTRSGTKAGEAITLSGSERRVVVSTLDAKAAEKAGVRGVMFTLRGETAGQVGVKVDPATFRNAYGGDFGSRLRLVRLPGCALTTPELAACQTQTPVTDAARVSLAAGVPTVLAAAATTGGPAGDYKATSLSPGGSWATSGNTGAFTYSYPIAVPAPIAGGAPGVSLNYNSAGQDARTQGTNNQSSWVGDGWSTTDNFVERTYKSCTEVKDSGAAEGSGDVCWAGQILTMSLNGVSTAIVYDDTSKAFRAVSDDAAIKIENLTGATNGTKNGEYFRVTQSGTQYYFGLNHLPGWTADAEETKSAWAEPVYKANAGVSACPTSTTFGDTACNLGYRFNLDYAVDLRGNATAYYYTPETGYYGANKKNTAVAYTRGGTLKRIDYGMTASTVYSAPAPEQVVFGTAERCTGDCTLSEAHPEFYPDVPADLNCDATGDCTSHSPSFWSRKKLTSITTQVRVSGAVKQLDRYDLVQTFPDGGDHAPTLWLESIKRTGLDRLGGASTDASTPAVTFNPIQLANRVGTLPGLPLMYHNRIKNVVSETGAETTVDYATPNCDGVPASDPNDSKDTKAQAYASTNTTGCFPVYWAPEGQPNPLIDWFYTHPVSRVTTIDKYNNFQDGSQPKLVTEYAYQGKPGWHYDDNEVVKEKNRTWGQFRGYPEVDVTTGDTGMFHYTDGTEVHDRKTLTKTYYFLGMDGDTLPDSKKRDVPALSSSDGGVSVGDNNAYAGQVFETVTYTGNGGSINKAVVTVPALIGPTASRARTGLSPLTAQMVRTARTLTREAVSYGWRKTETSTFYNTTLGQTTTGMAVQVADRGEVAAAGNVAKCTFNRYLNGKAATLVVLAEVVVTQQDCTAAGATATGTVLTDTRTSYDSNAFAYNGDGCSYGCQAAGSRLFEVMSW
ncbi:hypothetical protein [Actinoplanes sp. NPDC026619]|uniref:hypothetical protein n=1 Tax=Actinoplanes sp. NPDC026619 TaxID=3155798 RepID=UPI003402D229